jgi:hypothetical protein
MIEWIKQAAPRIINAIRLKSMANHGCEHRNLKRRALPSGVGNRGGEEAKRGGFAYFAG